MNSSVQDMEEEVWFDASEHGFNVKIKSAADLQLLLHSSPAKNKIISVAMSRTGSSARNLHYSNSYLSMRSASPDRPGHSTSPTRLPGDKRRRLLSRILEEVSKAAHPGIGIARGILISCFDMGRMLLRRNNIKNLDKKKRFSEKYWQSGITILAVVTLTVIIARRHNFRHI
jgi:hypothetical protein